MITGSQLHISFDYLHEVPDEAQVRLSSLLFFPLPVEKPRTPLPHGFLYALGFIAVLVALLVGKGGFL